MSIPHNVNHCSRIEIAALKPAHITVLPWLRGSNQIGNRTDCSITSPFSTTTFLLRVSTRSGASARREIACKGSSFNAPGKPLRAFSPLAQRTAKKLLNDTEDSSLTVAIELEGHCYSRLRQSDDFREGVDAFHAKRPPKFRGI